MGEKAQIVPNFHGLFSNPDPNSMERVQPLLGKVLSLTLKRRVNGMDSLLLCEPDCHNTRVADRGGKSGISY